MKMSRAAESGRRIRGEPRQARGRDRHSQIDLCWGATCEDTWSEQVEKQTSGVGPDSGPEGALETA